MIESDIYGGCFYSINPNFVFLNQIHEAKSIGIVSLSINFSHKIKIYNGPTSKIMVHIEQKARNLLVANERKSNNIVLNMALTPF